MSMKRIHIFFLFIVVGLSAATALAGSAVETVSGLLNKPSSALDAAQKKALLDTLKDPDVLNDALEFYLDSADGRGAAGFLKNLNLRFKMFEADGANIQSSLGLEYSFEKSVKDHDLDQAVGYPMSLSFNVHAKGNVAFESSRNPDDFLDTGASFDLFASKGGFEPTANPDSWAVSLQSALKELTTFEGSEAELNNSLQWKAFMTALSPQLSTQYFWRLAGSYSLESNQDFTKRQHAYGFHASTVIRAWNPNSAWAKFNIFDWPFAAVRTVLQSAPATAASGRALPLLLVGIDQIDAKQNSDRLKVDPDKSSYARWRGEASLKSLVAKVGSQDVWITANYRFYTENSPSAAIRAAKLHRFEYFAVGLALENGISFSYSTGKLPLDREGDKVFDVGFKIKF